MNDSTNARRRVILESPYSGESPAQERIHVEYARRALRDSLARGEAPIASHLLYTQVLDDRDPVEREIGISAGLAWRSVAEAAVFYIDHGMSEGMRAALAVYEREGIAYSMRSIGRSRDVP